MQDPMDLIEASRPMDPIRFALSVGRIRATARLMMEVKKKAAAKLGVEVQVTDTEGLKGAGAYVRRMVIQQCAIEGLEVPEWLLAEDWWETIEAAGHALGGSLFS